MLRMASCLGLIATIACCASCAALHQNRPATWNKADPPTIGLYEEIDGDEDHLCTITLAPDSYQSVNMKDNNLGCPNDEADSMKLHNMIPGTVITAYDSKGCGGDDDWQVTKVLQVKQGVDIITPSFQTEWLNPDPYSPNIEPWRWAVIMDLHYENGLNGNVSCLTISVPPA